MPANKYALIRYRIINKMLTNAARPYPTKEQLRDACERELYGSDGEAISISTIEKDIFAMRFENDLGFNAPIEYSRAHRGYFYTENDYSIDEIQLNEGDVDAIAFAARVLNQFKEVPIFKQYKNAIEKITDRVTLSQEYGDSQNAILFERIDGGVGNQWLADLLGAIQRQQKLSISYQKFNDDKLKKYALEPYLLKEYDQRWYLIAWDTKKDDFRTFGLDRLQGLAIGDKNFTKKKSFDADRFFKHSFGITEIDEEPKRIILSFAPLQGKYILSRPLHPSQKVLKESQKELRIELYTLETYELVRTILQHGSSVAVLEPKSLRKRIKSELKKSLSRY